MRSSAPRNVLAATLALVAPLPAMAAQPQFWKIEDARDFLDGRTEGLSIDSEGRLRLAPAARLVHDPEAPYVWCLARDPKGRVFIGTGNEGKVLVAEGGKGSVFFDATELEVHALAWGPDGRLYVGTSPDGKVYAVDASGKPETFYDPGERYVWALAFDRSGRLLVATGAEGKVYRVDRQGKAETLLTSAEMHVTALAVGADGDVFAGSAPGGIVYRVDTKGKVFVLHDSPFREVKALEAGSDGSVYAAVIDGREKDEAARPAPAVVAPAAPPTGGAEVTVTETFSLPAATAAAASVPTAKPLETARTGPTKGALLRVLPSGEVDTLWSSSEETPHALAIAKGGVWMGTGNKGQVYRVLDDRTWAMVATLPAEQVTALARDGEKLLAATSNPGQVHALDSKLSATGEFTSKVRDTETVSTWGRLRWDAAVPSGTRIEVRTRSGNTGNPDSTWTDWSAPYANAAGDAVTSERARFLQVKVTLHGTETASPELSTVSTAYLQRNLRPQMQSITVHPAGEVFQKPLSLTGEIEILGLEPGALPDRNPTSSAARSALPPATSYSRKLYQRGVQTFSWKAEDPNGDTLTYDVQYRRVGETRFRVLRRDLAEPVLAWDTTTVPNGRYVVRIAASDAASNPEPLALHADKESSAFEVDNTPPVVSAQAAGPGGRVRVQVKDDSSPVRRAEYSVDGGPWEEVHPTDGISDTTDESYEFQPALPAGAGPHMVVVRAMDLLGNVASARVELP
jgi:outer membrane protein assembly factor BamB